jgi:sulfoxide reductase heme-binding subunit YedZ
MTAYIFGTVSAALFLLIAALISLSIKYEGGANPTDPKKRKMWFYIMGILNPVVFFLLGSFVLAPDANNNAVEHDDFINALPIATGVGLVVYFVLGFILSKMFKNGKLGNWF